MKHSKSKMFGHAGFIFHFAFLIFNLLTATFAVRAQTNAASSAPMENRFLFILDTSSGMSAFAPAANKSILQLLGSNIQGQMRSGDTFGIWTYNEKLNTDFPMQVWSEDSRETTLQTVANFLSTLRYEKKPHLEKVFAPMYSVVRNSRTLTVVLVSDGTSLMQGTPFDSDINDLHKDYGRDLRAAHVPFLTVLAARNGEFFDYTVNSSIGIVRIPQTAEAPKKIEKLAPAASLTSPTPAPATPVKVRKEISLVHPQPPAVVSAPPPTEPVAAPSSIAQASNPNPIPVPSSPTLQTPAPKTEVAPAPTPASVTTPVAPSASAETKPAAPATTPISTPAAPIAKVEPKPEPPKTPPSPAVTSTPAPQLAKPTPPPSTIKTEQPSSSAANSLPSTPVTTSAAPALSQPATSPTPPATHAENLEPKNEPAKLTPPPAVAVASPSINTSAWILFSAAVILLAIAVALLFFILRRSRPNETSIISQSMDKLK